jgi:uncharacterized protein Yka (UPF0111/DUF47 family)
MKSDKQELVQELDRLASALEGARMLVEMAETDEEMRSNVLTGVGAVLTMVVARLMEVARKLDG